MQLQFLLRARLPRFGINRERVSEAVVDEVFQHFVSGNKVPFFLERCGIRMRYSAGGFDIAVMEQDTQELRLAWRLRV